MRPSKQRPCASLSLYVAAMYLCLCCLLLFAVACCFAVVRLTEHNHILQLCDATSLARRAWCPKRGSFRLCSLLSRGCGISCSIWPGVLSEFNLSGSEPSAAISSGYAKLVLLAYQRVCWFRPTNDLSRGKIPEEDTLFII